MLRVIQGGRGIGPLPGNKALRAAIARITRSDGHLCILNEAEGEALYRTLRDREFTPVQFERWTTILSSDHPFERTKNGGSNPGLLAWIRYLFMGGEKPTATQITESALDWRRRAETFVATEVAAVDGPTWLQRPLQELDRACGEVARETGRSQWATPVMRWALIQLLIIPEHPNSDRATG